MSPPAVETRDLHKTYRGGVKALKGLNLQVEAGICFGLLGPNGAGKSTLVKTLLSIVRPSAGEAFLNGEAIGSPRSRVGVGYLPEGHAFPSYLTGRGVCRYFGRLGGLKGAALEREIEAKLDQVGMREWADTKVTKYSKGMKQRVGLAQALLGDPSLVFLDEPTDGLDPIGRQEVREVIEAVTQSGVTVFFNSHLLSEVEQICQRVAIMNKGEVLVEGSVDELTAQVQESGPAKVVLRVRTGSLSEDQAQLMQELEARPEEKGSWFQVELESESGIPALVDRLRAQEVPLYELHTKRTNLEEAFVSLISRLDPSGPVGGDRGKASEKSAEETQ